MNKSILYTLIAVFAVLSQQCLVLADDWSEIDKTYNEAQFEKVITNKDYKNAIQAVKKYRNHEKKAQDEIKKQGLDVLEKQETSKYMYESPSRKEPLLTLPTAIIQGENIIEQGFYLAEPVNKDDQYYIRLTQGENRFIADIEAESYAIKELSKTSLQNKKVFAENFKNGMLKITYSSSDLILEAYVWAQ